MHESVPQTDPTRDQLDPEHGALPSPRLRRRLIFLAALLLALLLAVFLPPLIGVTRFERRIATSIGASIGRPVHFERAALSLLPLPGFTLDNFVVEEDPAFGSEPILRAGQVRVTLRLSALWRPRVEFSRISLTAGPSGVAPSVNLVHTATGRWNLEGILLQASRIPAAPTAQRYAGPAPRFPYIEATGARINLKLDQEKTPFALTDADFALWLPEPGQWRFRLEAHPARTDTAPADTGALRVEATLGTAPTLGQVPIDLRATWQDAQLGGLTRLLLGRDAGLRGDLSLSLRVLGALDHAALAANLQLAHARRADFVPPRLLSLEASCQAVAQNSFHAFSNLECHWPPADSSSRSVLILAAAVPDVRRPSESSASLTLPALPAATLLDWLRAATPHPPTGLRATGTLAGALAWSPTPPPSDRAPSRHRQIPPPPPTWSGELEFSGESLQTPALGPDPIPLGDILLRSTSDGSPTTANFDLLPVLLPLGGKQPATLEGHFDATGYTLHLTGPALPARLLALGDAIPQLGEGLRELLDPPQIAPPATAPPPDDPAVVPTHFDLTATRPWGGPQTWHQTAPPPRHHRPRH